jgi:hypothetical protein
VTPPHTPFDYPLADIDYLQCLLGTDTSLNYFPANVGYIGGMKRGLILLASLFLLSSSAWSAGTLVQQIVDKKKQQIETDDSHLAISAAQEAADRANKLGTNSPADETVEVAIPSAVHRMINPTMKSVWKTGKTYTIKWTSSLSNPVQIQIRPWTGNRIIIAASAANDGSYRWTVPSSMAPKCKGTTCRKWTLWVTLIGSPYTVASSGYFKILKGDSSGGGYKICKTGSNKLKWSSKKMYYYVNTKGGPSGALGAIKRGASVWNRVGGSSFKFIYRGRTASRSHGKYDGRNIVSFGPLKTGVLGENLNIYYTSNGAIIDSDIRFNTRERWSTKKARNAFDLQSTAAHEFGHSLCLEDLYGAGDKSKTMYGYGSRGDFKQRTLHPADKRGIQALY